MHSTEFGGTGVPAFLTKLWKLVEDPKFDELICWSPNGLSFIIHDQSKFSKDLLPLYFKHNNMASFIRQLNMYGFRKVMNIEQGRLRGGEKDDVEFFHQYFIKEQSNLLEFIKRKVPINRIGSAPSTTATSNAGEPQEEGVRLTADAINEILGNMSGLKSKQEGVDSQLNSMKQENEALWREVAYLRQKHIKQQQIVDKLIHFLVSLVQPKRNIGVKRKLPLMLEDCSTSSSGGKVSRLSRQFSNSNSVTVHSPEGPVIHDVTDVITDSPCPVASPSLEEEEVPVARSPSFYITSIQTPPGVSLNSPLGTEEHMEPLSILDPLQTCGDPLSPSPADEPIGHTVEAAPVPSPVPISQYFSSFETNNVPDVVSEETAEESESSALHTQPTEESRMQIALSDNSSLSRTSFINDHLDGVESELAWLQEQLSNGTSFNFDTSALLGLFSSDDTVPGNNLPSDPIKLFGSEKTGNELTQYVPSLLDLDLDEDLSAHNSPEPSTSTNLDGLLQTPQPQLHNTFNSDFEKSLV